MLQGGLIPLPIPVPVLAAMASFGVGALLTAGLGGHRRRREAEAELRRMHALLRDSQALAQVGGWELDLSAGTLFWTEETYRIHETSGAEYSPSLDTAIAFYAPASVPVIREAVRAAGEDGQGFNLELELITARKRRIWVQVTGRPIRGQGRIAKVMGAIQDITGRKRLEDQKHKVIFEQSSHALCWSDPDGILMEVNAAFLAMLGYESSEVVGTQVARFTHPDHLLEYLDLRSRMVQGTLDQVQTETRWLRKDGQGRWVNLTVRPVRDAQGHDQFHFGRVEDITVQREAQQNVERLLQEKELFLASANAGILLIIGRKLAWLSPKVEELLQYSAGELEGQDTRMLYPSLEAYEKQGEDTYPALARGETCETVRELVRKDGQSRWIHCNGKAIDPADPAKGSLWVMTDVTARREAETALSELNRELEERVGAAVAGLRQKDQMLITQNRQAAMGEMIGNIAHQWRQPLNALSLVLINLGDAQRFGELTGEGLERSLAKGALLIEKMSSTINDFSYFFKQGKTMAGFSALDQIQGVVALVEAGFEAVNAAIRIEAAEDLTLYGFPNEYSQVLLNLLSNAKQAIQDSPGTPGLVRIGLVREDGMGVLTVGDNGPGIAEDLLDRIFEPYFSTRASGTGIGLYMSKQIIEESLGGRITARNFQGGAEFSVRVPLAIWC